MSLGLFGSRFLQSGHPKDRSRRRPSEGNPRRDLPHWYSRGYLPHFATALTAQMVTYRLADSLPQEVVQRLARERDRTRNDKHYRNQVEKHLDLGSGACWLQRPEIAGLIQDSLEYFDGLRYRLHAYVIMPNHMHILVETIAPHELSSIVQRWKTGTARQINLILGRSGTVWQGDYWDRYIRDEVHYMNAAAYILNNPIKAGLVRDGVDWPWTWVRDELR